jgi:hypothetical protein
VGAIQSSIRPLIELCTTTYATECKRLSLLLDEDHDARRRTMKALHKLIETLVGGLSETDRQKYREDVQRAVDAPRTLRNG